MNCFIPVLTDVDGFLEFQIDGTCIATVWPSEIEGKYYLESENRFSFRGIDLSDVTIEEATAALTMLAVGRAAPLPDYGA